MNCPACNRPCEQHAMRPLPLMEECRRRGECVTGFFKFENVAICRACRDMYRRFLDVVMRADSPPPAQPRANSKSLAARRLLLEAVRACEQAAPGTYTEVICQLEAGAPAAQAFRYICAKPESGITPEQILLALAERTQLEQAAEMFLRQFQRDCAGRAAQERSINRFLRTATRR